MKIVVAADTVIRNIRRVNKAINTVPGPGAVQLDGSQRRHRFNVYIF
jgi:hypothetical protein